jgi:hypothetical protein
MEALEETDGARAQAWEAVLLLGDPETMASARAWHQAAWRLVRFARALTRLDQREPSMRETAVACERFYSCAEGTWGERPSCADSNLPPTGSASYRILLIQRLRCAIKRRNLSCRENWELANKPHNELPVDDRPASGRTLLPRWGRPVCQ